jgi:hypothetical protein
MLNSLFLFSYFVMPEPFLLKLEKIYFLEFEIRYIFRKNLNRDLQMKYFFANEVFRNVTKLDSTNL